MHHCRKAAAPTNETAARGPLLRRVGQLEVGELPGRHLVLLRLRDQAEQALVGGAPERADALIVDIERGAVALDRDAQRVDRAITAPERTDLARRTRE